MIRAMLAGEQLGLVIELVLGSPFCSVVIVAAALALAGAAAGEDG